MDTQLYLADSVRALRALGPLTRHLSNRSENQFGLLVTSSALHRNYFRLLWPRLTSASFIPLSHKSSSSQQTGRSPRVMRTHLHAYVRRIYVHAFRARIGL